MKTKRYLLAVSITLAAGACSRDVTTPDPTLRAPGTARETASATTTSGTTITAVPADSTDGSNLGSGCCPTNK